MLLRSLIFVANRSFCVLTVEQLWTFSSVVIFCLVLFLLFGKIRISSIEKTRKLPLNTWFWTFVDWT